MFFELVNTFATLGTFLVIAATAIAAVVQLRHARSSNHIAVLNEMRETMESSDFQTADYFVQTRLSVKLQDPAFRYQMQTPAARTDEMRSLFEMAKLLGNYYEGMGIAVKTRLVDKDIVFEMWADIVTQAWDRLAPVTAIQRRRAGEGLWENFENLTVLAQDWKAAHPKGTYPAGVRRIEVKDQWLEADREYAASLAPA